VVPPGLIDQWEGEIKKFATSALRVVKVYGGDKTKSTSNYKVEDIIKADVVIVNVNILDSKGYFENLLDMAGLRDEVKNIPKLPSYTGQQEQIQARGVWIPNTSQDPYAGGKCVSKRVSSEILNFANSRFTLAIFFKHII
ncbi:MAG: hypothetical protein ACI8RD_002833, partial [Bacillariaceae sp.]|jgi:hypothetical protein